MLMCVILITLPAHMFAALTKPTITVTQPATTDSPNTVSDGNDLGLTCAATGSGTITYTFYKGTVEVTAGVAAGVLTITGFSATTDIGMYTCVATMGSEVEESLQLDVQVGTAADTVGNIVPQVVKPTLTMTTPAVGTAVTETGQVELTCLSTTAGVTYSFYKDASTSALTAGVVGGVLTIDPFGATTDAGSYKCRAKGVTHLAFTDSDALDLKVGTAGGSVAGATTGTTGENAAGHLNISLLMLPLGTLLATIVF